MASLEGTKFHAWLANVGDEDECICLGGNDGGFMIEAFADSEDRIIGITLYDESGKLIEAVGMLPAIVLKREVENV